MISKGVVGLGGRPVEAGEEEVVVVVVVEEEVAGEEEGGNGRGAGPIIGLLVLGECRGNGG
jgi:hypothetical protein